MDDAGIPLHAPGPLPFDDGTLEPAPAELRRGPGNEHVPPEVGEAGGGAVPDEDGERNAPGFTEPEGVDTQEELPPHADDEIEVPEPANTHPQRTEDRGQPPDPPHVGRPTNPVPQLGQQTRQTTPLQKQSEKDTPHAMGGGGQHGLGARPKTGQNRGDRHGIPFLPKTKRDIPKTTDDNEHTLVTEEESFHTPEKSPPKVPQKVNIKKSQYDPNPPKISRQPTKPSTIRFKAGTKPGTGYDPAPPLPEKTRPLTRAEKEKSKRKFEEFLDHPDRDASKAHRAKRPNQQ